LNFVFNLNSDTTIIKQRFLQKKASRSLDRHATAHLNKYRAFATYVLSIEFLGHEEIKFATPRGSGKEERPRPLRQTHRIEQACSKIHGRQEKKRPIQQKQHLCAKLQPDPHSYYSFKVAYSCSATLSQQWGGPEMDTILLLTMLLESAPDAHYLPLQER
jgi:hypothetical protein